MGDILLLGRGGLGTAIRGGILGGARVGRTRGATWGLVVPGEMNVEFRSEETLIGA